MQAGSIQFRFLVLVGVALTGILAACSSATAGGAPRASRDVITREQMDAIDATTVLAVIQRLHPEFLRPRGRASLQTESGGLPVVYVDGIRAGGPEVLRDLPSQDVLEIRYIGAADATTRYGTGHTGGVIEIRIRG